MLDKKKNQSHESVSALLIFVVSAVSLRVDAATIHASDCSFRSVQSALSSAKPEDTVAVPSGNCTWSSALSISKAVILLGQGAQPGGTQITHGGGAHPLFDVQGPRTMGRVDISGFRLVGGNSDYWNGTVMQLSGPRGWKNLRIHHNVFEDNQNWTISIDAGTQGLIDNNSFIGRGTGIKSYGDGVEDWERQLELGTSDFFFVEANTFDYDEWGSTGTIALDMYRGGRIVFRNNTLRRAYFETHDEARSGLASANAYEIYGNTFWTDGDTWKAIDITAGTGVIWGNTFTGVWSFPIGAMDYKTFDPRGIERCDGNDPGDQNVPGENGWRCRYQIGSMGTGKSIHGYPLYLWNNTTGIAEVRMECTDGCSHLKPGRDYINNGATPKPGYKPFPFPHPLTRPLLPRDSSIHR